MLAAAAIGATSGAVDITVAPGANISHGTNHAIDVLIGQTTLTVGGTVTGGGGAVAFDQTNASDDTLILLPGFSITGTVFAGPGTDALVSAAPAPTVSTSARSAPASSIKTSKRSRRTI